MELKKQIGKRIQELRQKKGLTQASLAEKVGIATKHQSCIETGKNYPSAELVEKYSKALDIDVADVLSISHIKDNQTLKAEIVNMLDNNHDKIQDIYKIVKALIN